MKKLDVIRAWRDQEYYLSLSDEERSQIPAHPAGSQMDVTDEILNGVTGGCGNLSVFPTPLCTYCSGLECAA